MSDTDATSSESEPTRSVDQIEADLEATRRELGATIDAIGERLDVKSRVKRSVSDAGTRVSTAANDAVDRVKDTATDDQGKPDPKVLAIAGAATVVVVAAVVLVVRKRR